MKSTPSQLKFDLPFDKGFSTGGDIEGFGKTVTPISFEYEKPAPYVQPQIAAQIAEAVKKEKFDLILCGKQTTDGDTAQVGPEIAEATRILTGPSGNPECVWLGRRVVSLLWRDDLDTAFRHLDLYDRFGCPGAHIQATFRCLVRQGNIDPKAQETLNGRVHACWLNPGLPPTEPVAAADVPAATSGGTTPKQ